MAFEDLDPGDETRRNGDRIGFAHPVADGTSVADASPAPGEPVTQNADGSIAPLTDGTVDGTQPVAGLVFTYKVYGESSRDGPYVKGDRDATVGTRGSYVADLSVYADNSVTVEVGGRLGANGEIHVLEEVDATNNLYEVLVR